MDLLADYASSDEEGNEKQLPPPPPHRIPRVKMESESAHRKDEDFLPGSVPRRSGIFDSLPPPKASLFNSLPPPKSQSFANPKPQGVEHRRGVDEEISENPNPKSSSSSLFSSLPRPKSSLASSGAKKLVQFKPPVITNSYSRSLDEDEDDDDEGEEERKRKRSKEKISTSSPASFLSSIPAPRHSATLGVMPSASGTGRRSMLETSVPASDVSTEDGNLNVGYSNNQANAAYYSDNGTAIDGGMNTDSRNYEGYDHSTSLGGESYAYAAYGDPSTNVSTAGNDAGINPNAGSYEDVSYSYAEGQHLDYSNYGGGYGDYSNNLQYENNVGSSTALSEASGVVENMLSSVRGKRGRKDVPSEIVEVNQDELMKNRPREDQVKSTGIAFGPAYQPASTKGKPTKLHKRKHQIGSLYFDMRQKESELAERRSKGFLTKAQTQAKYGW